MTKYFVVDIKTERAGPLNTREEVEKEIDRLRKKYPWEEFWIFVKTTLDEEGADCGGQGVHPSWG